MFTLLAPFKLAETSIISNQLMLATLFVLLTSCYSTCIIFLLHVIFIGNELLKSTT